jgi:hypothetical protein
MRQRNFFEEVKYFNQQQSTWPTNCKDSESNVIIEQTFKKCKEYFYNICNPKGTLNTAVSITKSLRDSYEVSSPKYNDICTTINILKSNKAAGTDNIPPEFEPETIQINF